VGGRWAGGTGEWARGDITAVTDSFVSGGGEGGQWAGGGGVVAKVGWDVVEDVVGCRGKARVSCESGEVSWEGCPGVVGCAGVSWDVLGCRGLAG
jgi:hypothetical protein